MHPPVCFSILDSLFNTQDLLALQQLLARRELHAHA